MSRLVFGMRERGVDGGGGGGMGEVRDCPLGEEC